jgi:hypothetical protein
MGKKYVRVKARRILDVYMTIRDIKFSGTGKSAEMQRIEKMVDNLLQWMAGYCGKRSFNPFHHLDVFIIDKFGIKLEADHWLADPQKLGACVTNPSLFLINE